MWLRGGVIFGFFALVPEIVVAVDWQENVQLNIRIRCDSHRAEPVPEVFTCRSKTFCSGCVAKHGPRGSRAYIKVEE